MVDRLPRPRQPQDNAQDEASDEEFQGRGKPAVRPLLVMKGEQKQDDDDADRNGQDGLDGPDG
jgi:hypothetical protein